MTERVEFPTNPKLILSAVGLDFETPHEVFHLCGALRTLTFGVLVFETYQRAVVFLRRVEEEIWYSGKRVRNCALCMKFGAPCHQHQSAVLSVCKVPILQWRFKYEYREEALINMRKEDKSAISAPEGTIVCKE